MIKRISHDGSANNIDQLALYFGISTGSVMEYIDRCFQAIIKALGHLVHWPNIEERTLTCASTQKKRYFRKCIGFVDGTHLRLSQKPTVDGKTYYNRKGFYSLNCQIFCDERSIIFGIILGQTGSVSDANCLADTSILRNRDEKFFSSGEYLIADSGYTLSPYTLTPFRKPQKITSEININFNLLHSSAIVAVESTIGVLKVEGDDWCMETDEEVRQSELEVMQLVSSKTSSINGTFLNQWRVSVWNTLIADFIQENDDRIGD